MTRAGLACRVPGCASLQPCPTHPPKAPWSKGPGADPPRLRGKAFYEQRRAVLARDGGVCYICGKPGADMADHVIPLRAGGPDTMGNLRAAHSKPCHRSKTQREARHA